MKVRLAMNVTRMIEKMMVLPFCFVFHVSILFRFVVHCRSSQWDSIRSECASVAAVRGDSTELEQHLDRMDQHGPTDLALCVSLHWHRWRMCMCVPAVIVSVVDWVLLPCVHACDRPK